MRQPMVWYQMQYLSPGVELNSTPINDETRFIVPTSEVNALIL